MGRARQELGQSRYNLFAGSANLDAENRLGTVQAEFRRLSGLALGGDSDAAGQACGSGTSLLDLVKQTAGTEEEYLDAFWAVNAQLKSAQDGGRAQVSAATSNLKRCKASLMSRTRRLRSCRARAPRLRKSKSRLRN